MKQHVIKVGETFVGRFTETGSTYQVETINDAQKWESSTEAAKALVRALHLHSFGQRGTPRSGHFLWRTHFEIVKVTVQPQTYTEEVV